jgi:anthranilate synthase component 1
VTDDFDAFLRRVPPEGGIVPVPCEVVLDADTPVTAFRKVHRGEFGFLLESLEGAERWARYSMVGTEPAAVFRYRGTEVETWRRGCPGWTSDTVLGSPLDHLSAILRRQRPVRMPGLPPFTGGAVGFLGYDVVRTLEALPAAPPDDLGLPDAVMMLADTVLILDHLSHRATVVASVEAPAGSSEAGLRRRYHDAQERIAEWLARLRAPGVLEPLDVAPVTALATDSPFGPEAFCAGVARIKQYIAAGDVFQAVLSRRQEVEAADPFLTYRYLRALNPAPYLYYIHADEMQLVGGSPEVLIRVEEDEVIVRPIAGTRPRGATPDADAAKEAELRADPKERAEHLMLVDLGRNDVGRVARFGSVRVTELMVVERYSHVMHLVSEVRGALRPDVDALAALAAAFPAGTVSGAPKVRAMEIVDELEPVRRGPYAGAVGYIGWGGRTLDTAITIRTAVIRRGRAWVQAGAGIVADSDPEAELAETEAKAGAVLAALAMAARAGTPERIFPA